MKTSSTISTAFKEISFVKEIWKVMRIRRILKQHSRVAEEWREIIEQYYENKIQKHAVVAKKDLQSAKIIWQYWSQGLTESDLPEVVQICFQSVNKYKGEYQVIRLTDKTIQDYIELPEFVWEKRKNPAFKAVFFSDLLRLALLHAYGGVWLDATILLSGNFPDSYGKLDYFVFQRDRNAKNKTLWESSYAYYWNWDPKFRVNLLNSIFFAKKDSKVVNVLLDLMLYYWQTKDKIMNYFFFQILYDELMRNSLAAYQCPIVDDTLPHLLQTKINGGFSTWDHRDILEHQTIHKLTYFDQEGILKLKEVLNY